MVDILDELLSREVEDARPLGSLDYIDSLPLISGRDAVAISNVLGVDELLPTEVLPRSAVFTTDNRRYNPTLDYDPGELVSGAARLASDPLPPLDPFRWERKYIERLKGEPGPLAGYRRAHPELVFFTEADRVKICLDRAKRREIMMAKGYAGRFYKPRHFNPYSRVRC